MRQAKRVLCAVVAAMTLGLVHTPADATTSVAPTMGNQFTYAKPNMVQEAQRAKPLCKRVCVLWGTRFVGPGKKPSPVCRKRKLQCPS